MESNAATCSQWSAFGRVTLLVTALVFGGAKTAHAFDFKGLVLGEPITTEQIKERIERPACDQGAANACAGDSRGKQTGEVKCSPGNAGATLCNGHTTVAGFTSLVNIVIGADGKLRRVWLTSVRPENFETIAEELQKKFGDPKTERGTLQNGFGATFQQVEHVWTDAQERQITFSKFARNPRASSLYFSTKEDRELMKRISGGVKGDL